MHDLRATAESARAPIDPSTGLQARQAADPDERGWVRPAPDADALRWDVMLAGGLYLGALLAMVLVQVSGMYTEPAPGWVSALLLAATTLPLAVRRRWPAAVLLVVATAFITAQSLSVPETLMSNIALFCAMYTVGAWEADRRRAALVRGVVVVAMILWLLVALFMAATDPETARTCRTRSAAFSPFVAYTLLQLLINVLYFAGAWWFGEHAWRSARERARTAWRTRLLVLERRRSSGRRSRSSGCGSRASCTTRSPTTSRSWACRPRRRGRCSAPTPTGRPGPRALEDVRAGRGRRAARHPRHAARRGDASSAVTRALGPRRPTAPLVVVDALPDLVSAARRRDVGYQVVGEPRRCRRWSRSTSTASRRSR